MSKRFSPIMFRVPGKPGLYNMEELLESQRPPRMVEPVELRCYDRKKGISLGVMPIDLAVQKFDK